jgi:hypothetical protein
VGDGGQHGGRMSDGVDVRADARTCGRWSACGMMSGLGDGDATYRTHGPTTGMAR